MVALTNAARIRLWQKQLREAETSERKALRAYNRAQVKAHKLATKIANLYAEDYQKEHKV